MGRLLYDKKRLDKRLQILNAQSPEPTSSILKIKEEQKKLTQKAKALVVKRVQPANKSLDARYAFVQF